MPPSRKHTLKNSEKVKRTLKKEEEKPVPVPQSKEKSADLNDFAKARDDNKNGTNGKEGMEVPESELGEEGEEEQEFFSPRPGFELGAEEEESIEDILGIPSGAHAEGGGTGMGGRERDADYDRDAARGAGAGIGAGVAGAAYTAQAETPGEVYARTFGRGQGGPAQAENPFYGAATEYSSAQNYFQRAYQPSSAAGGRGGDEGRLERMMPSSGASRDEIPHGAQQEFQVYQERVDVRELLDLDTPTEKKLKRDRRASRI